ncbi:MAG TPA: cupin-like domain-containing protein [Sphingomonas sp.]
MQDSNGMDDGWIDPPALSAFAAAYPARAVGLAHRLTNHPLLRLDALAALAGRLPDDHVEHSLGNLAVDQDPDAIARIAAHPADIVRTIADNGCWMVMKKIDCDPAYTALVDTILAQLAPVTLPATGRHQRREAFLFLSAPDAVTPFHMDPEHNILFQIAGTKTMRLYPADDPAIVSAEQHEAFHRGGRHRNMRFDPAFDAQAETFMMAAGDAVYVPVKAPHWVQNGPTPSISLSITWRSDASDRAARLHRVNHRLRTLGVTPSPTGAAPHRDAAKIACHRAVKALSGAARRAVGRRRDRVAY